MPFGGDPLADANGAHRVTDCGDRAHELVSDDERGLDPALRPCVPGVDMMVRAAQTRFLDANQHVGGPDLRYRDVGQEKAGAGARFDEGSH